MDNFSYFGLDIGGSRVGRRGSTLVISLFRILRFCVGFCSLHFLSSVLEFCNLRAHGEEKKFERRSHRRTRVE